MSIWHALTHSPYNEYCCSCQRAKMQRRPARRIVWPAGYKPTKFGDLVSADTIVAQSEVSMGLTGERDALVIVDRATNYKDCFPLMSKHAEDAHGAMLEFFGEHLADVKRIHTDMAPDLINAVKQLHVAHSKSTPYRHQGNSFCERTNRKIIEGARTLLEHAGLPSCFWTFAVRHWCFMDNTEIRNGESSWNLRHGEGHFAGKRYPFGCLVGFLPPPKTVQAMPKFEPRANQGILVGYRLHPGGRWAKDFLVFPKSYFEDYDFNRPRNMLELVPIKTRRSRLRGRYPSL